MLSQLNRRVQPEELSHRAARLLSAPGSRHAPRSAPTASPGLREMPEPFVSQICVGERKGPPWLLGTQHRASVCGEELQPVGDALDLCCRS